MGWISGSVGLSAAFAFMAAALVASGVFTSLVRMRSAGRSAFPVLPVRK